MTYVDKKNIKESKEGDGGCNRPNCGICGNQLSRVSVDNQVYLACKVCFKDKEHELISMIRGDEYCAS